MKVRKVCFVCYPTCTEFAIWDLFSTLNIFLRNQSTRISFLDKYFVEKFVGWRLTASRLLRDHNNNNKHQHFVMNNLRKIYKTQWSLKSQETLNCGKPSRTFDFYDLAFSEREKKSKKDNWSYCIRLRMHRLIFAFWRNMIESIQHPIRPEVVWKQLIAWQGIIGIYLLKRLKIIFSFSSSSQNIHHLMRAGFKVKASDEIFFDFTFTFSNSRKGFIIAFFWVRDIRYLIFLKRLYELEKLRAEK